MELIIIRNTFLRIFFFLGFALFVFSLTKPKVVSRIPSSDLNKKMQGHWVITTSTCDKELSDKEIQVAVDNKDSVSHAGYLDINPDGTYSQVLNPSPYCKKGKPEDKALYTEGYSCDTTAQTDGKYNFLENGTVTFDGAVAKRSDTGLTAGIGLGDWKQLQWQKKGKVLVLIFPPDFNVVNCMNRVLRRYYVDFEGS